MSIRLKFTGDQQHQSSKSHSYKHGNNARILGYHHLVPREDESHVDHSFELDSLQQDQKDEIYRAGYVDGSLNKVRP